MPEAKERETQRRLEVQTGPPPQASWLDRRLDLTRVDPQIWIFLALLVIAVLLRFWDLGSRAMHHDEGIHAWYSWRFYTGEELYHYNPTFHGPLLYHLTALSFFLFGVSDAIARVPEALFGVLMVALCYPLRHWLGRWGWLIAAGLLSFSPAFVYFSRFARHDAFAAPLTLAVAIALFRYLEERRPRDLALAAAALALSYASHELTFITSFILLTFLGLAYLLDFQGKRFRNEGRIIAGVAMIIAVLWQWGLASAEIESSALQALPLAVGLLAFGYLGLSFLWARRFPREPSPVQQVIHTLVKNPRPLLVALGVFGLIFGLLFTNFLTHPRGFLDGLTEGIQYWLGQHEASRGDQPWFYYLMLLPVYEPLVLLAGLAGLGVVLARVLRRPTRGKGRPPAEPAPAPLPLFPIFLAYWAIFSLVLYSWAGEKMPWLLLHVALPLLLLAGLALDRFLTWVSWRTLWRSGDWAVAFLFLLVALAWASALRLGLFGQVAHELAAQYMLLQTIVLVIIALALVAVLVWRIYASRPRHLGQSLAALGILILGLYTIRSAFLLNFYHGDIPREMLVYTQTAPDVPLVVRQIERLSIDQTRDVRTVADPTGGHGLTVFIDTSRGAALDLPFNWYLRDFARAGTLAYFDGTMGPPPEGDVLLILAENEPDLYPYLQGTYTGMRLKHRWWFPEYDTYRRWTLLDQGIPEPGERKMPWLRPNTYSSEGAGNLLQYLFYRQLPYPLGSQDFYYYVRSDLLPAGVCPEADPYVEKLVRRSATRVFGSPGTGPGQLSYPRAIALDEEGYLYVADSGNHRIVRFDPQGESISWGGECVYDTDHPCLGQFNEPWGIAVDEQGRVYVADTWNHRIEVFDREGNFLGQWGESVLIDADTDPRGRAGTPFAFFGPRGLAVDGQGRIYVTDTGNERVMVYAVREDAAGQIQADYLFQVGTYGPEEGNLIEPVGVAVDLGGRLYVADTWNRRIQVFAPSDDRFSLGPAVTWEVPGWDSESRENKPFLAVGPGGQVYFTVPDRHYAVATDGTGNILAVWGGYGTDTDSFQTPSGVAVDSRGQVYVSDSMNGRVMVFTIP